MKTLIESRPMLARLVFFLIVVGGDFALSRSLPTALAIGLIATLIFHFASKK